MARTSTQIQADLDAARAGLSSPWTSLKYRDYQQTQDSVDQRLKAIAALESELTKTKSTETNQVRVRQIRLSGSSGF